MGARATGSGNKAGTTTSLAVGVLGALLAVGCASPIAAALDEPDANRVVTTLDHVGIDATKEADPQAEGKYRVTVARDDAARALVALAERLDWPLLADPLSGVRFAGPTSARVVDAYDLLLQGGVVDEAWHPEAVVQLGTPVVSAPLQRLLAAARPALHVVVAPPGRWPDPVFAATDVVRADPAAFATALSAALPPALPAASPWSARWCVPAAAARAALDELLARETRLFEGTVLATVTAGLADGSALHVGNSLPVRALDVFVGGAGRALATACNRGASGIDGVVATALGAAAGGGRPTALVVGDLSFLHDLGALQIAARHRLPLLVVVVNNDGGGIFSFLPQAGLDPQRFELLFGTPHGLALDGAVAMCGGRYECVVDRAALAAAVEAWRAAPAFTVIEVPTDRAGSRELHAGLVAAACRGVVVPGADRRARPVEMR